MTHQIRERKERKKRKGIFLERSVFLSVQPCTLLEHDRSGAMDATFFVEEIQVGLRFRLEGSFIESDGHFAVTPLRGDLEFEVTTIVIDRCLAENHAGKAAVVVDIAILSIRRGP